jgi:hypothetical protein
MKLHSYVDHHELLCTSYFWIISPCNILNYCPLLIENSWKTVCVARSTETIWATVMKLHSYVDHHEGFVHLLFLDYLPLKYFELLPFID